MLLNRRMHNIMVKHLFLLIIIINTKLDTNKLQRWSAVYVKATAQNSGNSVLQEPSIFHNRRPLTFDLSMIPSRQSKYVASLIGSLGFSISGRVAYDSNEHRLLTEKRTCYIR